MSTLTERRAAWFAQIATDGKLPACGYRVAIALAEHINAKSGDAWPSVGRLADELGTHPRVVQKGLSRLLERGHLTQIPGGGRGRTNVYRMQIHNDKGCSTERGSGDETTHDHASFDDEKPRPNGSETTHDQVEKGACSGRKPRPSMHPNLLLTPDEPRREPRKRSRSRMHPDAVLGDDWLLEAEKVGIPRDRAEHEFEKFRDHHLSIGSTMADWTAAWRKWCRNAVDWQQQRQSRGRVNSTDITTGRGPLFGGTG